MFRKIILIPLVVCLNQMYSQEQSGIDYIITISDDTIVGAIKDVNFYKVRTIMITAKGIPQKYKVKQLKELSANGVRYTTIRPASHSNQIGKYFTKPLVENGAVNAFQKRKIIYLTRNNFLFTKKQLKYFADDYPYTTTFLKKKNNPDSLLQFIQAYNDFKVLNPNSQSFAEKNIHYKKIFNPQMALNFTGIVPGYGYLGAELGLNSVFTLTPRLSYALATINYETSSKVAIVPFAELGIKCYPLNDLRIKNKRSTFLYSGYNFSATYMKSLQKYIPNIIRAEFGFKEVSFSRFYLDYSIGTIYLIENDKLQLWAYTGLGYVF